MKGFFISHLFLKTLEAFTAKASRVSVMYGVSLAAIQQNHLLLWNLIKNHLE
jgi:hypothetical protein